jgi:hypothetical protein
MSGGRGIRRRRAAAGEEEGYWRYGLVAFTMASTLAITG